jgi:hypothetical protein
LSVQERHREKEPGLAAYDLTLVVSGQALITTYDEVRATESSRFFEHAEGKTTLKSLHRKLRMWAAHVADRIEGVDMAEYGDNPEVAEDLIADANALIERVNRHAAQASEPLPFMDALIADLTEAIEAAKGEWRQAEVAASDVADMRRAMHEAAEAFERDLISYRRALASVIGRNHPDFQKLRLERVTTPDEDDDENAPESGDPDTHEEDNVTPLPTPTEATEEAATP